MVQSQSLGYLNADTVADLIISGVGEEILDGEDFAPNEIKRFEKMWESEMASIDNETSRVLYTPEQKEIAFQILRYSKKNLFTGKPKFQGALPQDGFGARGIIPEDVFVAATIAANVGRWDSPWIAGAAASQFSRNWIGSTVINTVTFNADGTIRLTDNLGRIWNIMIWGVTDLLRIGAIEGVFTSMANNERGLIDCSFAMRQSLKATKLFDRTFFFRGSEDSFKFGVQVKLAANAALKPIGLTILDPARSRWGTQGAMPLPILG